MSEIAFNEIRTLVLADAALQDELRTIDDMAEFTAAVIALALRNEIELTTDDVENAVNTGRRAWIERWI